jgi:hypothetical protein
MSILDDLGANFVAPGYRTPQQQQAAGNLFTSRAYRPAPITAGQGIAGQMAPPSGGTGQALNAIIADFTSRGEGIAGQRPSQISQAAAGRMSRGEQAQAVNPLDALYDAYIQMMSRPEAWETVGGPNQGMISALNAQRQQLQKNYATNKADANNLYGILSSDIEDYGAGLQERFGQSAEQMSAAETARVDAISAERAAQDARRAAAAAELGLSMESLQMAPDATTNELVAANAGAASNWANLFEANRLREDASTGRQLAGATATKNQQLIAMKNFLDQQQSMIDQEIAMERSKSPSRQLTAIGKALQAGALGGYENLFNPKGEPLYSENPQIAKQQQGFELFGKSMSNPADLKWYNDTFNSIVTKMNNAKAGVSPGLTADEKRFQMAFGITGVGLGTVDPNLLY